MMRLSVIIPCYNEEENIFPFIEQIKKIEKQLKEHLLFEYIFVDDGSTDKTLERIQEIRQNNNNIFYLSFSRNFGKESAMLAGMKASKGDYITIMDADLQDPPELLLDMFDKIKEGYDIVGTRRINRKGEPLIRSLFSKMFYKIMNLISEIKMIDGLRDFSLMTRQVVDSILSLEEVNRFSKGIFSWVGYRSTYLSYENRDRVYGKSSWNFWSLLRYSFEGFINFSEALLNIAVWSGTLSFILSIIGIIFIVVRKLTIGGSVNGWASLVTIILLIGGIQLLCIGILGKYISKIFLETKKRPLYFIKEKALNNDR
ncbi:glycosyltransferase family 2 protein [Streptococcus pacificus]|uniref:Glycosyltransferase family 2 protein n=1 Tax=Streptococcus pacificus TaxID=2740577 RepID=A0ABS0ZHC7_9STRE|nr:glycosyltransferase family 2 protein [Streptococcus pacificus]MBJ8325406.1 glycosyltransferase family 2 protein [Streptococcus pacificus]